MEQYGVESDEQSEWETATIEKLGKVQYNMRVHDWYR